MSRADEWPPLPLAEWQATRDTLHMWTQVVGKVRLALAPYVNHWWQVPLYVSARGLTTSAIPARGGNFEVEFDFVAHQLRVDTSWGETRTMALAAQSVSEFYKEFMDLLKTLEIAVRIWPMPVEIPEPIRFDKDMVHASYDAACANQFWRVLTSVDATLKEFRGGFIGKASPVHFFWGSFDLAATRFSGRRAPERPGADRVTKEAYSHEVISAGWWPGGGDVAEPMFYAYAAPAANGFREALVRPAQAFYHVQLAEFLLPYEAVRTAANPREALLEFLHSTYEAGANLGKWNRGELER